MESMIEAEQLAKDKSAPSYGTAKEAMMSALSEGE